MNSLELTLATIQSMRDELQSAGVAKLWLFGSAARGEVHAKDLDFLVEFAVPPSFMVFMNLKFLLEDRLSLPVDLHTLSSCPDRFLRRIQTDLLHVA